MHNIFNSQFTCTSEFHDCNAFFEDALSFFTVFFFCFFCADSQHCLLRYFISYFSKMVSFKVYTRITVSLLININNDTSESCNIISQGINIAFT